MAIRRQDLNRLLEPLISLPDISQSLPRDSTSSETTAQNSDIAESTSTSAEKSSPKKEKGKKRKQTENQALKPAKRRKKESSLTIDNFIWFIMADKTAQPRPFPEPRPILNTAARNLLDSSTTYESDGFLYHFYKSHPPVERPDKLYHPRSVSFYLLDTNL